MYKYIVNKLKIHQNNNLPVANDLRYNARCSTHFLDLLYSSLSSDDVFLNRDFGMFSLFGIDAPTNCRRA